MFDFAKGNGERMFGRRRDNHRFVPVLAVALLLVLGTCLHIAAQGHGGGGHGGGPDGGGPGGGFPGGGGPGGFPPGGPGGMPGRAPLPGGGASSVPSSRGPMQRGPAGRWWDESKYAQKVGLTGDQQRRMDGVFADNREALVSGLDNLRRAEARLNTVSADDRPNEFAVGTEIQNVAQARADLEKANTHLMLQIRNEMTQEQVKKLDRLK